MKPAAWLISWIGDTDHRCAEGKLAGQVGPIATALQGSKRYDRVYLLTNYDHARSQQYCKWLEELTGYPSKAVDLYSVELKPHQLCRDLRQGQPRAHQGPAASGPH